MKTLRLSTRWVRSRFVDGALILGYHRVAEVSSDSYSICVTPRHFAEQLEVIRQEAHPITLTALSKGIDERRIPRKAVAVTFDDGYADTLYAAKPLLERHAVPATVFLVTGNVGQEFWWDELERTTLSLRPSPDRVSLTLGHVTYSWRVEDSAVNGYRKDRARLEMLREVHRRLLPLPHAERERAMSQVRRWQSETFVPEPNQRCLSPDEIVRLDEEGFIEIGAHSVTHPVLPALPAQEQKTEVESSKSYLESLLGKPVKGFSFPNGASSEESLNVVKASGYQYACTSCNDVASNKTDRFLLPRFWIPDWDGDLFLRWLRLWGTD